MSKEIEIKVNGEWFILDENTDIEDFPTELHEADIQEYKNLPVHVREDEYVRSFINRMEKYFEHGNLWLAYADAVGEWAAKNDDCQLHFCGTYKGEEERLLFVKNYLEDTGFWEDLPKKYREIKEKHLNLESLAKEFFTDMVTGEDGQGTTYVFYNH